MSSFVLQFHVSAVIEPKRRNFFMRFPIDGSGRIIICKDTKFCPCRRLTIFELASPPLLMVVMKRLLVIALLFVSGKFCFSQISDTTLWIPNGPVNAVLLHDSLLYVG